jgi:hypothetical protein
MSIPFVDATMPDGSRLHVVLAGVGAQRPHQIIDVAGAHPVQMGLHHHLTSASSNAW